MRIGILWASQEMEKKSSSWKSIQKLIWERKEGEKNEGWGWTWKWEMSYQRFARTNYLSLRVSHSFCLFTLLIMLFKEDLTMKPKRLFHFFDDDKSRCDGILPQHRFPFSVISNSPKCFWKVALKLRATDEVEREFSRSHSFNFGFSNGGNWTLKRGKYQRGYLPSEILQAHLFPICSAVTFSTPSFQRHPISALSLQFSPTWNVLRPFFPPPPALKSFVT